MENKRHLLFLYLLGTVLPTLFLYVHFDLGSILLIIINLLISYIVFHYKKLNRCFMIAFISLLLYCIINNELIMNTVFYTYNCIIEVYNSSVDLNLPKLSIFYPKDVLINNYYLLSIGLQYIISNIYKCLINKRFILFVVSIVFILPSLIVRIKLNWILMTMFLIYCYLLLVSINKKLNKHEFKFYIYHCCFIILILCVTVSSVIRIIPEYKANQYYKDNNTVHLFDEGIHNVIKDITKYQLNQEEISLENARNRTYTGSIHLNVESNMKQTYYLKYYSGSVYNDNKWKMLQLEDYENASKDIFDMAFISINSYLVNEQSTSWITIHDERRGDVYSLYPYYLRSSDVEYSNVYDAYLKYDENSATFSVWNTTANNKNLKEYTSFVNQSYLNVPNELNDLFKQYLSEYHYENISFDKAKDIILDFLEKYSYTLKPGATPADVDFVTYFLQENKKGYCVHFATTATLMFRYLGIPARYVEGYRVDEDRFNFDSSIDKYNAEIIDSDAHAWVEIYDSKLGWIPVEVTVGTNIDSSDENPTNNNQPQNPTINPEINQNNNQQQNNQNNTNDINNNQNNTVDKFEYYEELYICLALVFIIIIYLIYKSMIEKSYLQKDNKKAIYSLVKYYEKLNKYKLIDNNELISLFEKNKFSKDGCSREEVIFIRKLLKDESNRIYKEIHLLKKIKFKLIDCL